MFLSTKLSKYVHFEAKNVHLRPKMYVVKLKMMFEG